MKNHSLNIVRCCLLIFCLLIAPQLFAQKTITGIVTDGSNNESLIGGNVLVKGNKVGTVTDLDGKYQISASPSDILVFSYIGMEKQEFVVGDKTVINITLKPSSNLLTEVVAIGYGFVKKSDLTGSVAVVSAKELTKNPATSAAQALQGKAPGVLVTQSGAPGGGATIRVRGVGSINKGADPIYILDGVQVGNINGIQPQDIESLQVLKDASATSIYGANGSNGVIIVTTKRGKSGKTQVNLNTFVSFSLAPKQYDIMNADQYSAFYTGIDKAAYTIKNPTGTFVPRPEYGQAFREKYYGAEWQQGTNWQDQLLKNGLTQNYNLSLAGGGENSNFSVSLGYIKEDGTAIKSNAERYNIRANSDFKISKYVKIGENLNLNYSIGESPVMNQSSIWELNASPLMKVYNSFYKGGFESPQTVYLEDADGNLYPASTVPAGYTGNDYTNTVRNDKPNPLAAPSMGSNKNYNLSTNASVYMQIDFADWIMFKITPSAEIGYGRANLWSPAYTGNRSPGIAVLQEGYYENINLNLENQLLLKKTFNDVHNIQATAVYQIQKGINNTIAAAENGFDFEQLNTLTNGGTLSKSINGFSSQSRMLSYLGRIMYDYKGKYFATGSYRSDGIYLFPTNSRRGNFMSASVAWKINEDLLKNVKEIDALKLRLGWGQTGNSAIGGGFQYVDKISEASNFSPVFGDDQKVARAQYVFYGLAASNIQWESSEMSNFGLDLSMFNGKIQASAEYYLKNNNNLLIQLPTSYAFGRENGFPWANTGKIQNRGIEFSLQWKDKIGDFNYGIISSFTTIKNKVLSLPISDITSVSGYNRSIVGHSIGALYGYSSDGIIQLDESNYAKGVDGNWQKELDSNELWTGNYLGYKHALQSGLVPQPGDLKYKDLNGDGVITALDKTLIGKTIPSITYTIGFDCSYKNFDFNIFLFGVNNFDIYNKQRASLSSMNTQDMGHNKLNDFAQNHWTVENKSTTQLRVDQSNRNVNDQLSSFWVEDGSFLRIKDVQFGYTLSKTKCASLGVGSIRAYANASNIFCFTAYKGRDPEPFMSGDPMNSGIDDGLLLIALPGTTVSTNAYPIPRSFTFGLQIGF